MNTVKMLLSFASTKVALLVIGGIIVSIATMGVAGTAALLVVILVSVSLVGLAMS